MKVRPQAVIVDVDGTLCDVRSIRHLVMGPNKDFDKFHRLSGACPPHDEVVRWARDHWDEGRMVLIVTARKYKWEFLTERYCRDRLPGISFAGPFMRGDRDDRPDVEVKREIHEFLSQRYDIVAAIDDNPSIVTLWRSLGIETTVMPGWDEQAAAAYVEQANRTEERG